MPRPETALSHARLLYVGSRSQRQQSRYQTALATALLALQRLEGTPEVRGSFAGVLRSHLATLYVHLGDHATGSRYYREALMILQETNEPRDLIHVFRALRSLAALFVRQDRSADAIGLYEEMLRAYEMLGWQDTAAYVEALSIAADLNFDAGRYASAHRQAEVLYQLVQGRPESAEKVTSLARVSNMLRRIRVGARQAEVERQETIERESRPGPP